MIQIVTGIFLAMNYIPHVDHAFNSVERIMRDVPYGWLIRYVHAVGASMFFVVTYIHLCRGLYFGSYKSPREILWFFGIIIFLTMMATAFMGYVLPWGQMSFWGATVISGLFSAFDEMADTIRVIRPVGFVVIIAAATFAVAQLSRKKITLKIFNIYAIILGLAFLFLATGNAWKGLGTGIQTFLLGGFTVENPTLNRFFALHFLLPFVILGLVFVHLIALHTHGSNNPTGVEVKTKKDTISFHPYYTIKDFFGFGVFFLIFFAFVFFAPNDLGHPDNYIPADALVTPPHIVPEWYFLPFYAILRAVPDIGIPFTDVVIISSKLAGVLAMFGSILILFALPWLDRSETKSGAYRPMFKWFYWVFIVNGVLLGYMGAQSADGTLLGIPNVYIGRACTLYYFGYFVAILPILSKIEKSKPLPNSIYESTLVK
jgi:ubiquinol-cytochrome c reductase cytochrome b/c1 subunit